MGKVVEFEKHTHKRYVYLRWEKKNNNFVLYFTEGYCKAALRRRTYN